MLTIKVFLDTNVLIDVLSVAERPATEYSIRIFQEIRNFKLEGVITVQSVVDAAYAFRRDLRTQSLFRDRILQIKNYVNYRSAINQGSSKVAVNQIHQPVKNLCWKRNINTKIFLKHLSLSFRYNSLF